MIRSMFTAINSMYLNQQYLDVVADNLSNVNTPGFKSSFVRFKDQFAQNINVGGAPSNTTGGTNPVQIGLGTNLGTIGKSFTQGALTATGNDLDMAISGDGFFVYSNGITNLYSRDGSLALDAQGMLVHSSSGYRIQGWMADALGHIDTGSPLEDIQMPIDSTVARETTEAYILGNLNSSTTIPVTTDQVVLSGTLSRPGGGPDTTSLDIQVQDLDGITQTVTLNFTRATATTWDYSVDFNGTNLGNFVVGFDAVTGDYDAATSTANPSITVGTADINLDLSLISQPTGGSNNVSVGSQTGTAAGSYDVTMGVYDRLGNLIPVVIRYTRTNNPNVWTYGISPNNTTSTARLVDENGDPVTGTIRFDTSGQYVSSSGLVQVRARPGAEDPVTVELDLSGMTMLDTASSAALGSQNGLGAGSLMGFTVSSNTGEIYGAYSNGDQRLIGQLSLAMFVNPTGLVRQGDNYYTAGLNSGEARIGAPDAGGRGAIASGYVEGSNVDMSREFSNMILAQRGFQASSRIINASDAILQELVNLGR